MALLLPFAAFAASAPTAPSTLTQGPSSTFDESNYAPIGTNAIAGNITQLTIKGISQTRAWQGYYGNVSGTITLDDANNNTFYNWTAAEPRGYIYASIQSIGTPDWSNVVCGLTGTGSNNKATNFHQEYNISSDDYDNVTNTYYETLAGINSPQTVYVTNNSFKTCPATTIWQSDAQQNDNFVNYLMFDSSKNENDSWIFGTIIEEKNAGSKADKPCFDGNNCDFQLLVAENGHGTDKSTTPYYFWVDLTS